MKEDISALSRERRYSDYGDGDGLTLSQCVEHLEGSIAGDLATHLQSVLAGVERVAAKHDAAAKAYRKSGGGVNSIMAEAEELLAAELREVVQKEIDARGPEEGREAFEAYQEATAKAQREHDPRPPFRREYQGQWMPMPTAYRRRGEDGEWRVVAIQNGAVLLTGPGPCRGRKVVTTEKFYSEWDAIKEGT